MKHDIPDPSTPEGMAEINRRLKKVKPLTKEEMERAIADADNEPSGMLTNPTEIDLWRGVLRGED